MVVQPTVEKPVNGKMWLGIINFVVPSVLGIVFAYGTSRAANAALEQRVLTLENDKASIQRQLDYYRDNYPSRAEITPQLKAMTDTLDRIESPFTIWNVSRV